MKGLSEINFHDGYITNFKTNNKDIEFEFIDGYNEKNIFKINLKNVEVFVQEYKTEVVNYTIDKLLNSTDDKLYVFAGDYGNDNNKKFLKIWIDYPLNTDLSKINEYNSSLDNIDIKRSSEFDDVGKIFIKFIADDIEVIN